METDTFNQKSCRTAIGISAVKLTSTAEILPAMKEMFRDMIQQVMEVAMNKE